MFIWGRDSTVIFNGANLAFDELESAIITHPQLKDNVLKKTFYKVNDEHFEIWLELNEGVERHRHCYFLLWATTVGNNLALS